MIVRDLPNRGGNCSRERNKSQGRLQKPFKGRLTKEKEGKDKSIQDDDMVSTDKEQEQS